MRVDAKAAWRYCAGLAIVLACFAAPLAEAQDITPGYWELSPLPQTGLATFYAPGMMEYVEGYRQSLAQLPACPECVGTVALLRAGDIGRKVWLQSASGERVGPFLVIDCARRQDVDSLLSRGWVVDVSYELGQVWGMDRPLAGMTVLEDPADAAVGIVRPTIPTPFYVPPGEVVISAPTATPAVAEAAPTPWPTRLPEGLAPRSATREPSATPPPPTPRLPTPLTPIVTTPTPEVTATPTGIEAAISATATPAPEVSVGRAGGGLLEPASVLTPAPPPPIWPTVTPTARPAVRTPRPDLTPILPPASDGPKPMATPIEPSLLELWQDFWEAVLH